MPLLSWLRSAKNRARNSISRQSKSFDGIEDAGQAQSSSEQNARGRTESKEKRRGALKQAGKSMKNAGKSVRNILLRRPAPAKCAAALRLCLFGHLLPEGESPGSGGGRSWAGRPLGPLRTHPLSPPHSPTHPRPARTHARTLTPADPHTRRRDSTAAPLAVPKLVTLARTSSMHADFTPVVGSPFVATTSAATPPPAASTASDYEAVPGAGPGTPRYGTATDAAAAPTSTSPASGAGSAGKGTAPSPGTPRYPPSPEARAGALADALAAAKVGESPTASSPLVAPSPGTAAGTADVADVALSFGEAEGAAAGEGGTRIEAAVAAEAVRIERVLAIRAAALMLAAALAPQPDGKQQQVEACCSAAPLGPGLASALRERRDETSKGSNVAPELGGEGGDAASASSAADAWRGRLLKWRGRVTERCDQLIAQIGAAPEDEAAVVRAARARAQPWADAVLGAKIEVIDPNLERLAEHLSKMREEQVEAAASELSGSRLRDVVRAKSLTIHRILQAAMDDVEAQFCAGMTKVARDKLPQTDGAAEGAEAAPSDAELAALCTSAIGAFRLSFDLPWALQRLEAELTKRIAPTLPPVTDTPAEAARAPAASPTDDPAGMGHR